MKLVLATLMLLTTVTVGAQTLPPGSAPVPYNPASYVDTSGTWHWGEPPIAAIAITLLVILVVIGFSVYFRKGLNVLLK
jgi:hypothetical protein